MTLAPRAVWVGVPAVAVLVLCLAPAGFAREQEGPTAAAATPAVPGYLIGPSDVLQIIVWKEPDLTRDLTVRIDGKITVPLLGDVEAAGRTPVQLADSLAQGLKQYVETPKVTVGVAQTNSARFYIVGLVSKSGEYLMSGRMTVLQALALAGGFRDFAKTDSIVIVRRDQTVVPVNYKRITDGRDLSQNVLLLPDDTIVVP